MIIFKLAALSFNASHLLKKFPIPVLKLYSQPSTFPTTIMFTNLVLICYAFKPDFLDPVSLFLIIAHAFITL